MNRVDDVAQLKALVDMKYRYQQQSFSRILVQENRLRTSLRQLDEHLLANRDKEDSLQKGIGADVVWYSWVGRKKRELNIQLAQILALKERQIIQIRSAFGKAITAEELFSELKSETVNRKKKRELDDTIEISLFQTAAASHRAK